MFHDVQAHAFKIFVKYDVGISQNLNALCFKILISFGIVFFCLALVMLCTVKFNDQPCPVAIKIDNIWPYCFLSIDGIWQRFEKIIPQFFLFRRHVFSHISGVLNITFVVFVWHFEPHPPLSRSPFPKGKAKSGAACRKRTSSTATRSPSPRGRQGTVTAPVGASNPVGEGLAPPANSECGIAGQLSATDFVAPQRMVAVVLLPSRLPPCHLPQRGRIWVLATLVSLPR